MRLLLAVLFLLPLSAAEFKSEKECVVGTRVADRKNQTGKVLSVKSSMCEVVFDAGGKSSYLFWMLHPAGASAETDDTLRNGVYKCYASRNGVLSYISIDVKITSPTAYENSGQKGKYRVEPSRKIIFEDGPLAKFHAKLLAGPRIGLNTTGDSFYGTTCGL